MLLDTAGQFREAARRDLEGERVRFEAGRKRAREAAAKEVGGAKAAEADRAALTLAEHARELREVCQEQAPRTCSGGCRVPEPCPSSVCCRLPWFFVLHHSHSRFYHHMQEEVYRTDQDVEGETTSSFELYPAPYVRGLPLEALMLYNLAKSCGIHAVLRAVGVLYNSIAF